MTRAERRRAEKAEAKREQYAKSGFRGAKPSNWHRGSEYRISGARSRSTYKPHYGRKEQAKAALVAMERAEE